MLSCLPPTRLFDDLEVLNALMKDKDLGKVPDRYERNVEVLCDFGDVSCRGLGSTTQTGEARKSMLAWEFGLHLKRKNSNQIERILAT